MLYEYFSVITNKQTTTVACVSSMRQHRQMQWSECDLRGWVWLLEVPVVILGMKQQKACRPIGGQFMGRFRLASAQVI